MPLQQPLVSGQLGIRLREALADGRWQVAQELLPTLDRPHRVEILLGTALRDGRNDFSAARLYVELETAGGDWGRLFWMLGTGTADRSWDDLAAAYVAARQVPDRWIPEGRPLEADPTTSEFPDVEVARHYGAGVGGRLLLECFRSSPLYPAVKLYYEEGNIHALGPRPLLVLAAYGQGTTPE